MPVTNRARAYVRSRAAQEMAYTCRIERVSKGGHDRDTLVYTTGSRTVVYEGKCRIWEEKGASAINLGDSDLDISSTMISTPYDAPVAKKNDEVVILNGPSQDTSVQGRRYQIQSSAKAGELRATRTYSVTAVAK